MGGDRTEEVDCVNKYVNKEDQSLKISGLSKHNKEHYHLELIYSTSRASPSSILPLLPGGQGNRKGKDV
jgi:hypothetical protein